MLRIKNRKVVFLAALAASFGAGMRAAEKEQPGNLYQRLGGMPAIQAVIDDYMTRILADNRVSPWFAHAAADPEKARAYKSKLADFICQATGGPCKYIGTDMFAVHKGRGVTEDAFNALVSDLGAALDKLKVPEKEKAQLLGLLAPMKPAIVQDKQ